MIQSSEIHVASIVGNIKTNASVQGYVSASPLSISADVSLGRVTIIHSDMPDYEGEYEATPQMGEQTLNTKNKTMRDDFVVKPIPYYDVANEYGRTIYIGGNENA